MPASRRRSRTRDRRRGARRAVAAAAAVATPRPPIRSSRALVDARDSTFPAEAQAIVVEGLRRTIDWQDPTYASLYLDRLARVQAAAPRAEPTLVAETARHLALWMTYEDTSASPR